MDQSTKPSSRQYSPYFASVKFDPSQDTEADRIELTRKFISLPRAIKYGLLDTYTDDAIRRVANLFGIGDPNKASEISRIVRDVFFDKMGDEVIRKRAQERLDLTDEKLERFTEEIRNVISMVEKRGEEEIAADLEELPVIPALKKYERLGEQEITDGEIQIEISDRKELVRPTIRNWLEDYIQNKGAQAHDNLERSDYLYKSQNTERLSTGERDKLSVVLRSYDLDELVMVGKDDQELVFGPAQQGGGQVVPGKQALGGRAEKEAVRPSGSLSGKKFDLSSSDMGKGKDSENLNPPGGYLPREENRQRTEPGNVRSKEQTGEIYWYGSKSPFDNLERIDSGVIENEQQGTQERLENRSALARQGGIRRDFNVLQRHQKTKHVVDLKEPEQN